MLPVTLQAAETGDQIHPSTHPALPAQSDNVTVPWFRRPHQCHCLQTPGCDALDVCVQGRSEKPCPGQLPADKRKENAATLI